MKYLLLLALSTSMASWAGYPPKDENTAKSKSVAASNAKASGGHATGGYVKSHIDGGDSKAINGDLTSNTKVNSANNNTSSAHTGDQSNNQSAHTGDLSSNVSNQAGDTSLSVGGDTIVNNETYLALALRFPQAAGCFSGFQGGDSNNGRSSFLGFHILNHDCWMNVLAQQEGDIELNARLKCGSRKYRNAVAFEKRSFLWFGKKAKQKDCVERVIEASIRTLNQKKDEAEALLKAQKPEVVTEIKTVYVEVEGHPHKENDKGYLIYNGKTYINRDRAYAKDWVPCDERDKKQ